MKDNNTSRSPARKNDGFHRYLKPGALAQIRNSRINSRSPLSYPSSPISSDRSPVHLRRCERSDGGAGTASPEEDLRSLQLPEKETRRC
ncbi:hypothetical protein Bca52824_004337 [Brassica carinata]|uniref:Uncharacterized protein n=1 Tax=Brassica carinata TaxID=52824 RepID=A0A8X8BFG0_BRACI|nr:hypothetical protein Bca52824_004337 [Brassica carinata]